MMGYLEAQEGAHARTAFRTAEKMYKKYKNSSTKSRRKTVPPTDLSQVLDFRKYVEVLEDRTSEVDGGVSLATEVPIDAPVFVINGHPGFYFIPQALSVEEQFYWIRESLASFPQPPNRSNHNAMYGPINDLWSHVQERHYIAEEDTTYDLDCSENLLTKREDRGLHDNGVVDERYTESPLEVRAIEPSHPSGHCNGKENAQILGHDSIVPPNVIKANTCSARVVHEKPEEGCIEWRFLDEAEARNISTEDKLTKLISAESLLRKLRWATIGQQFDWAKVFQKCYNTMLPYKKLPVELSELAARLAEPAMKGEKFLAQGAIVNYYGPDDMLGGHIDDMEADWTKPIVSISLGCKAIFLLGGPSREERPVAMFLRSGDVVLMAGPARRCFHGVPRIFVGPNESDLPDFSVVDHAISRPFLDYIKDSRININVRQVY